MIRSAVRPVTNVDAIWSTRSTSTTSRNTAAAPIEHPGRAAGHAAVDAGLHQVRPGQPGQRVEDDERQPEQQRAAELLQQPEQAELALVRALGAHVELGAVAHRAAVPRPGRAVPAWRGQR